MKRFKRVYVEITNICNLNCSFCPKNSRAKSFMSLSQFRVIAEQISPLTDNICLHLMGEPLLHQHLKEIVEISKQNNLSISLTTNGTLLSKNLELLKDSTFKKISISLHSYEANRLDISLEEYLEDISLACIELSKNPDLIIEFRLWNDTSGAKNHLNEEIFDLLSKYFKSDPKVSEKGKSYKLKPNVYLSYNRVFDWPINTQNTDKDDCKFCYGMRTHIGILCDGTVVPCCLDSEGKVALGNIFNESIDSILSSDRAINIYNGFTNRHIKEEFCQTCTYAGRFKKK